MRVYESCKALKLYEKYGTSVKKHDAKGDKDSNTVHTKFHCWSVTMGVILAMMRIKTLKNARKKM